MYRFHSARVRDRPAPAQTVPAGSAGTATSHSRTFWSLPTLARVRPSGL